MYTSLGKANDRFGFKASGQFRCAYRCDRIAVIAGGALVLAFAVLIILNFVFLASAFGSSGSIGELVDIDRLFDVTASGSGRIMDMFSSKFVAVSATFITSAYGMIFFVLIAAAYIIMVALLRYGKKYEFTANEERFVVTYPERMHRTDSYKYDDVLGVTWKRYKFPLLSECYDITVTARSRKYEYRVVLTKIARVNGIVETPFNYIRERTGVADKDEEYLLDAK